MSTPRYEPCPKCGKPKTWIAVLCKECKKKKYKMPLRERGPRKAGKHD